MSCSHRLQFGSGHIHFHYIYLFSVSFDIALQRMCFPCPAAASMSRGKKGERPAAGIVLARQTQPFSYILLRPFMSHEMRPQASVSFYYVMTHETCVSYERRERRGRDETE